MYENRTIEYSNFYANELVEYDLHGLIGKKKLICWLLSYHCLKFDYMVGVLLVFELKLLFPFQQRRGVF